MASIAEMVSAKAEEESYTATKAAFIIYKSFFVLLAVSVAIICTL